MTGIDTSIMVEWLLKTPWTLTYFANAGKALSHCSHALMSNRWSSSKASDIITCGVSSFGSLAATSSMVQGPLAPRVGGSSDAGKFRGCNTGESP